MRSFLATALGLALMGLALQATSVRSIAQTPHQQPPFVTAFASISEPQGWIRLNPVKKHRKGWFIGPDSEPKKPLQTIFVDVSRPLSLELRPNAEYVAKDWGGKVLDEKTTLDGVEALRVRVDKPQPGLQPSEGVVALRDGKVYLLMGGAAPGRAIIGPVEEVRKSWKWLKK